MIITTTKEMPESGTLPGSVESIHSVSDFAKNALFYCSRSAHFFCCDGYIRARQGRGNYLLLYVLSGTIDVHIYDKAFVANTDDVILLDRHVPHDYSCRGEATFLWFHFNSNNIAAYYSHLLGQNENSVIFRNEKSTLRHFNDIVFRANPLTTSEETISLKIHSILTGLISTPQPQESSFDKSIATAVEYIMVSYQENITIEDLARMASLSIYHFIRQFKEVTGHTPHQFLLQYRILQAKLLLEVSNLTSEQISEKCGFNSASHFSRAFRKECGVSPMQYRKDST